jgi:hypothetical protein
MSAGWADAVRALEPSDHRQYEERDKSGLAAGPAVMILPRDICLMGEEQYTAGNMAKSSLDGTV